MATTMLKNPGKNKSSNNGRYAVKESAGSQLLSSRGYSFDKKEICKKQANMMKEYNEIKRMMQ